MVIVNRRRRPSELPTLPSLTVDIARVADSLRPIRASVDMLTVDTVVVTCESGVDALAVAMSPQLELTFRGPGLEVRAVARPGRRIEDVHGNRCVELVLDETARQVTLLS